MSVQERGRLPVSLLVTATLPVTLRRVLPPAAGDVRNHRGPSLRTAEDHERGFAQLESGVLRLAALIGLTYLTQRGPG